MGYIDKELGIKSSAALEKYLIKELNRDIVVSKLGSQLKVTWAIDSKLYSTSINASVIYVIRMEQLDEVIDTINNSLKKL